MLDLNRINAYEPFEVGELRIFQFDGRADFSWKMAWEELMEHCKLFKITLNSYSISKESSEAVAYTGDLNFVALSSGAVADSPQIFLEHTQNWRYRDPLCYFKLVRYASKLEIPSDQKKHWLHFVITTKPEAFSYKCIQYV